MANQPQAVPLVSAKIRDTNELVETSKGMVQPIILLGGFMAVTALAFMGRLPSDQYLNFFLMFAGLYAGTRAAKSPPKG